MTTAKQKTLIIVKQIIHSIIPSLILFLMPRGIKTVFLSFFYVAITFYIYHEKSKVDDKNNYDIAIICSLLNIILISGYVESDEPLKW